MPALPFAFRKRDRAAPGDIVRHRFFITHELLPEPEIFHGWFIQFQHTFAPMIFDLLK